MQINDNTRKSPDKPIGIILKEIFDNVYKLDSLYSEILSSFTKHINKAITIETIAKEVISS